MTAQDKDFAANAAFAAAMLQGVAATLRNGEPPDLAQAEVTVTAVADALGDLAVEASRRSFEKSVEGADLRQAPVYTMTADEAAGEAKLDQSLLAGLAKRLEEEGKWEEWAALRNLIKRAGAPEGEAQSEAELDRLLDRLLDRFLRRLENEDWVAWLALDELVNGHAVTLAWPEVKEAIAEYRRTGKVTRRDVTATLYGLKAKGQLQDAEGRILLSFGEEDDNDQVEGETRRLREDIVVVEARIKETKEQIAELDEELALERAARDSGDPDFIEAIFQQLEHERETYGILLACDEETLEQIRAQLDDEDDQNEG